MKKILSVVLVLTMVLAFAGCNDKEDALHMGYNFRILAVNSENMTLTVEDIDGQQGIEGEIIIPCSDIPVMYCDYKTQDVREIEFSDLTAGDEIMITAYEKDLNALTEEDSNKILKVSQIQLGTQRLSN